MHTIRSKLLLTLGGTLFVGSLESVAKGTVDLLFIWQERATQRYALASLDQRMLADIGLTRADAWREAAKPFWRA